MRRKAVIMLLTLGVALSFSFLVPLAPVDISRTWSTTCPPGTVGLCSIGDGGLLFHAYGSLTYRLFGVGGAWYLGHFEILRNGCYVMDNGVLCIR